MWRFYARVTLKTYILYFKDNRIKCFYLYLFSTMSKRIYILLLMASTWLTFLGQNIVDYTKEDSLVLMSLLQRGHNAGEEGKQPLFFANLIQGTPYVSGTLDKNKNERLVLNMRSMDCTTFVENVTVLTQMMRQGKTTFQDYCKELQLIRYADGAIRNYADRNHYFSAWIKNNEREDRVEELRGDAWKGIKIFLKSQTLQLDFMTNHAPLYAPLCEHPALVDSIRNVEKSLSGMVVHYLPKRCLNRGRNELGVIKDGDILMLVTNKQGLDCTHVGLAAWKSNQLYMWHASSRHKRVLLEPTSLHDYLARQSSILGVRVIRIK